MVRLLFTDPAKEFHLRELSRQSHLAIGTIQKEVCKLSEAELLVPRRDGNRLYFRANAGHLIFPELQGIAKKLSDTPNSQMNAFPANSKSISYGLRRTNPGTR
jgi:hypothetical protein